MGADNAAVRFDSVDAVDRALTHAGYLPDEGTSTIVHVASRLGKPLLVEGPAGTGKTALAHTLAEAAGVRSVRLQCYEGLDETKVLYEWNYRKQLLGLQASEGGGDGAVGVDDVFSEPYLLSRPVLDAIRSPDPVLLLIDEVDRIEMETEALLLEVLSDFQVSIPELGLITAASTPFVVLTSNATRELSEALKRRCLYLWLDYPTAEREREIVRSAVPGIEQALADQVVHIVHEVRELDLKKPPSIAETLDWAATLVEIGARDTDRETLTQTLGALVKHHTDLVTVRRSLDERASGE